MTGTTAVACLCGFTEQPDENLTDHLERVFTPAGMRATDGQVHEEADDLACACGLAVATPGELDAHFLIVFTPDDGTGSDGSKHGMAGGGE
jgi:hypothetical protein